MAALRGVILDVDGTLVDSNDAHARAWVDALAEAGFRADFGAVRRRVGMGGDKLLPAVSGLSEDSPEGKRVSERRKELFRTRYLPSLRAWPGATELLLRMKQDGLRLAVASSAKADELRPLLALCGADRLVEARTSSDDADNSKPDPDIVETARAHLGLSPDEVLMLGDTPYDIEAAARAGVGTLAFRCGGWDDAGLRGAVAVYDGPADLLARYEESPFGSPEHPR
jgi:HAD superfamily hydrolase (TIGR01509 family)